MVHVVGQSRTSLQVLHLYERSLSLFSYSIIFEIQVYSNKCASSPVGGEEF